MRWEGPDGYWASDDRARLDIPVVHGWMSREAYWALGRSLDAMTRAIEHSLVVGLYTAEGTQAGFARQVTDYATFTWLCDVFVDTGHRGHGLGTFLVEAIVRHPDVRGLRQVLATAPERTLYRRFGFVPLPHPDRWLEQLPGS
jgi:GNAT superfamily N-acetyltransferase